MFQSDNNSADLTFVKLQIAIFYKQLEILICWPTHDF